MSIEALLGGAAQWLPRLTSLASINQCRLLPLGISVTYVLETTTTVSFRNAAVTYPYVPHKTSIKNDPIASFSKANHVILENGSSTRTRTWDTLINSQVLLPTELCWNEALFLYTITQAVFLLFNSGIQPAPEGAGYAFIKTPNQLPS